MAAAKTEGVADKIKSYFGMISGAFAVVASCVGGVAYMDSTFASNSDVQIILQNQTRQLQQFDQSQKANLVFQLEYYDGRILQLERSRALQQPRANIESINDELANLRMRREFVRKSLTDSMNNAGPANK